MLNVLGFESVQDSSSISEFAGSQKMIFRGVPDRLVYQYALKSLDKTLEPHFLFLVTAQSHPPYRDEDGNQTSRARVWSKVDEALAWFYEELDRRNFFHNGILLITGDHRELGPVTSESAARDPVAHLARVPLFAFGRGIPAGNRDDRLLDQASVFRFLDKLGEPAEPFIPASVFIPLHSPRWNAPLLFFSSPSGSFEVDRSALEVEDGALKMSERRLSKLPDLLGQARFVWEHSENRQINHIE
jgi:hypothetical protein